MVAKGSCSKMARLSLLGNPFQSITQSLSVEQAFTQVSAGQSPSRVTDRTRQNEKCWSRE